MSGLAGRFKGGSLLLLVFTILGFVAGILGYLDYRGGGSLCPSSVDVVNCGRVYAIPQATIVGLHLSELALVYFTLLTLVMVAYILSGWRWLLVVHLLLSIAGLSLVPYLIYLELAVARALCIYCTIMHLSIIGSSLVHLYRL